jgi:hypothetical protein
VPSTWRICEPGHVIRETVRAGRETVGLFTMKEAPTMSTTPESDAAYQYRLAQAGRAIRFCKELGISFEDVGFGIDRSVLDPIRGADGKIIPEPEDFAAARIASRRR